MKTITSDKEAVEKLYNGVKAVADYVGATLGPLGRNVAFETPTGNPYITHDGVTVAKQIELEDPTENLGVKLMLEASSQTNDKVGDGTTSSAILASAIIEEALKIDVSPMTIKREIEAEVPIILDYINQIKTEVKDIEMVATISAQDSSIGSMVADAVNSVGKHGIVTVETGRSLTDSLKIKEGMSINSGYISPYFMTNADKLTAELEDPYILITDATITNLVKLKSMFEELIGEARSLLVIADDVDGVALNTLIANKINGVLPISAIRIPAYGPSRIRMLEDIAVLTGGAVLSDKTGKPLESCSIEDFGKAQKVVCSQHETLIIGGSGDTKGVTDRIEILESQLENETDVYQQGVIKDSIARLSGKVAVITVGGATETEIQERKYRIDDAVYATQAAIEDGIVVGGSISYLNISNALEPTTMGCMILKEALLAPFKKLLSNAGIEPDLESVGGVKGIDVLTGEKCDLVRRGIIDPAKVVKNVIVNSISVAMNIITTSVTIVNEPERNSKNGNQ